MTTHTTFLDIKAVRAAAPRGWKVHIDPASEAWVVSHRRDEIWVSFDASLVLRGKMDLSVLDDEGDVVLGRRVTTPEDPALFWVHIKTFSTKAKAR